MTRVSAQHNARVRQICKLRGGKGATSSLLNRCTRTRGGGEAARTAAAACSGRSPGSPPCCLLSNLLCVVVVCLAAVAARAGRNVMATFTADQVAQHNKATVLRAERLACAGSTAMLGACSERALAPCAGLLDHRAGQGAGCDGVPGRAPWRQEGVEPVHPPRRPPPCLPARRIRMLIGDFRADAAACGGAGRHEGIPQPAQARRAAEVRCSLARSAPVPNSHAHARAGT